MKTIKTLFRLFLPLLLGSLVGFVIKDAIDYGSLAKLPLSPPRIFFPVAWILLYLLMGISYTLYRKNNQNTKIILLYYAQLFVNLFWSIFFFNLKWRLFSIGWILFLLLLIIQLIKGYQKEKKISAYLLIPYLVWCLFAAYLNIGVYLLN